MKIPMKSMPSKDCQRTTDASPDASGHVAAKSSAALRKDSRGSRHMALPSETGPRISARFVLARILMLKQA